MTVDEGTKRVLAMDAAFRAGDMEALRHAAGADWSVPNGPMPLAIGHCLEYAIYHSPITFIAELLSLGADPNPADHHGYPPLVAALTSSARTDLLDVLRLLLEAGADPDQRGFNDYTPLHVAAAENQVDAVRLLLEAGADPGAKTRIDDYETPLDVARVRGSTEVARLLEAEP